jgi:hypothetical protein
MQISIIGEYELTRQPTDPALVIHHVIRGYDVVHLIADHCTELAALISTQQKRIRTLGNYQLLLGDGGDLTIYTAQGQRACYFNPDQVQVLRRFLAA